MRRYRAPHLGLLMLAGVLAIAPSLAQARDGSLLGQRTTSSAAAAPAAPASGSYLGQFNTINTVTSTVPANGDLNPYGVAVVPRSYGKLVAGDVLVSNFNAASNKQGTGTTIVEISPAGKQSLFAQINAAHLPGPCPGGVGLTTALAVLSTGWVFVGSLPTTDGTAATAKAGCVLVLNSGGQVVETIAGPKVNGPWDMASADFGTVAALFVTNVLNGTVAGGGHIVNGGTVLRIVLRLSPSVKPQVLSETFIGSRFPERTDPAALVIGPTGVGLGKNDTLYVADSIPNRVAAISNALFRTTSAMTGTTVTTNGSLNDPLGLTIAPNGDILTVNGNDGNAVETTAAGTQVMTKTLDSTGSPPGAGTLFGLTIIPGGKGLYFVDDGSNTLNTLTAAPRAAVTIKGFAFHPTPLTIKVGTVVTWTNQDAFTHTVTADDGSFNSGNIPPGTTYTHTFTATGTVTYHCMIHPFMHGTVTVTQ